MIRFPPLLSSTGLISANPVFSAINNTEISLSFSDTTTAPKLRYKNILALWLDSLIGTKPLIINYAAQQLSEAAV
jgi:hypothetical protein